MSIFTKRGADAVTAATTEESSKGSTLVSFKSGTTLKVRVKDVADSAEYYAYGVFGSVNTFVPANPSERNAKGFVTANPTVWDRAADLLYKDAKAAKEAGDTAKEEELKKQAYNFKGKPRYLMAFGNLETGEDIIVDLTKPQASSVMAAINKYAKKIDKMAFELSKTGEKTSTKVTLSPIIDMDEDLTDAERTNFEKAGENPFDFANFEDCLFVADEAEQIKNLVVAGFDIGRLGLSIGAAAQGGGSDEVTPITDEEVDPTKVF